MKTEGEDGNYYTVYQNEQGKSFFINQNPSGAEVAIDTENADYQEIQINERKALICEKDGRIIIAWYNDSLYLI